MTQHSGNLVTVTALLVTIQPHFFQHRFMTFWFLFSILLGSTKYFRWVLQSLTLGHHVYTAAHVS